MTTTSKKEDNLKNEDNTKNEDDLKSVWLYMCLLLPYLSQFNLVFDGVKSKVDLLS